ncbi:MAG: phosphoribosyltransferase family protein [Nanoarchaeota archaeon]
MGVVEFKEVDLRNGGKSNYYINIKKAYGYPEIKAELGDWIYSIIPKPITCIACSGHGGIPLADYISSKYGIKLSMVRDKSKEHGLENLIDGYVPNEKDIVGIVDDVFSTGSSLRETIKNIGSTKAKIVGCYVVVKRGKGILPVELKYLLTHKNLIKK